MSRIETTLFQVRRKLEVDTATGRAGGANAKGATISHFTCSTKGKLLLNFTRRRCEPQDPRGSPHTSLHLWQQSQWFSKLPPRAAFNPVAASKDQDLFFSSTFQTSPYCPSLMGRLQPRTRQTRGFWELLFQASLQRRGDLRRRWWSC